MPEIPGPACVLRALAPLWPPLYTALEWATQQTRAYFDAERLPIDRHLAPSLVRYQTKRALARLGHDAREEEGEAYAVQTLPNNGLSLSHRADHLYVLRLLKALEGQLPAPGASRARPSGSSSSSSIMRRPRPPSCARASTCWCCGRSTRPSPCGGCRWCVRESGA